MKEKQVTRAKAAVKSRKAATRRQVQSAARSAAGVVQAVQTTGPNQSDFDELGPELPGDESPEAEAAEDLAEDMSDPNRTDEFHVVDGLDNITRAVCEHYGHQFLAYSERFTRQGFPQDKRGVPVRVTRMYHVVNLCLDILPAGMSKPDLLERKATIEALGYSYTYWFDNEHKQDPKVIFRDRLKKAPADKAMKAAPPPPVAVHGDVKVMA